VDIVGSCLLDASTLEPIPAISLPCKPGKHSELYVALLTTTEEFRDLLAEYLDEISFKGFSAAVPKHPVCHSFAKARRLDGEKLEFQEEV